jgi:hypothetical protein
MSANSLSSSLSLIFRSYLADLRHWTGQMMTGYALTCGFMLVGTVSLLIAIGIGVAAGFHALELRYDIWIAYAVVGGAFLVLGILGLTAGRVLLARPAPALPRPSRQADMLKRAIAAPVAARLITTSQSAAGTRADTTTQALATGAAVLLLGWFVASRVRRRPDAIRE